MEIEQKDLQHIYAALDNIKLVLADTNELVQKINNILDRNEEMEARTIDKMASDYKRWGSEDNRQ